MKTINYTFLTIILLSLVTLTATAKKVTYPGQVTTIDNQIIKGDVYILSPTLNELKVKIKDTNKKNRTLRAKDVQSYSFEVQKYNKHLKKHVTQTIQYVKKTVEDAPIRFGTKNILVLRPVNGDMNVYRQYVETDSKIGGGLGQIFYVEKTDGSLGFTKVTKRNYKKVMKEATANFPALNKKIGTRGFGYKHIVKMAKAYNQRHTGRNNEALAN